MLGITTKRIHSYEAGLYFRDNELKGLLDKGRHWFLSLPGRVRIDVVSQRDPWLEHGDLDIIVRSGLLNDHAIVLDLKDYERALVWIDGRFARVLNSGLYAIWKGFCDVRVEIVDSREIRFQHNDLNVILESEEAGSALTPLCVAEDQVGVVYYDGKYVETLKPGQYAFWKRGKSARVFQVDTRECSLDIAGQEIMTADKVTLRMNAVVNYRVTDPARAVSACEDIKQALYRSAQLALRSIVGTRDLDTLLCDKDTVAQELETALQQRAREFGMEIITLGIRDVILPGEMKELMNRVTEAKKAAEANLISRREETAAMRSQANTAKLLENNPMLLKLKELEVLEKVSGNSKLNVVLGEKGLAQRVVNLL